LPKGSIAKILQVAVIKQKFRFSQKLMFLKLGVTLWVGLSAASPRHGRGCGLSAAIPNAKSHKKPCCSLIMVW